MAAVLLIARAELRRRVVSLVLLAALVALVVGVVLATAAGAHRTATALDRFRSTAAADDATVWAQGGPSDGAAAQLASLPGVEAAGTTNMYFVLAGTEFDASVLSSPDASSFQSIDRPRLLSGRMPSEDAPDEVVLSELAVKSLGVAVGDHLSLPTFGAEEWAAFTSGATPFPTGAHGPVLDLTVVGTVRVGNELQGSGKDAGPVLIASPAFTATYEGRVAQVGTLFPLRLAPGTDPSELADRIRSLSPLDGKPYPLGSYRPVQLTTIEEEWITTTEAAVNVVAIALAVFTVVAGLAGLVAVGQSVLRQLASCTDVVTTGRALGLTRTERAAAVALPSIVAIAVGSVVGVVGAVLASPLFPVATARRAEPGPGIRFDAPVLLAGWVLAAVVLGGWAALVGWRRARLSPTDSSPSSTARRSWLQLASGRTLPVELGARLALNRERSAGRLSVRTAIAGVVVAVAGVVAVAVFLASVDDTLASPGRWGWTWDTAPDVNPPEDGPAQTTAEGLKQAAADPDLAAVGALLGREVDVGGVPVNTVTYYTTKGTISPAVLTGRLPAGTGEVALGQSTMKSLGVKLGDTVAVATTDGRQVDMVVVGQVVLPLFNNNDPGSGAVLAPDGFAVAAGQETIEALVADVEVDIDYDSNVLLRFRDGVDRPEVERRLASTYNLTYSAYSRPQPPGRLQNLRAIGSVAWWLGGFFALLGVVGLVHALLVTVRRRRRDLAVLETFGMIRTQVRRVVSGQSVTITACGLLIGVPVGVVLGRATWTLSVRDLGMVDPPANPIAILLAVVVAGLVLAVLVAVPPGLIATRRRPAAALRSE